MIINKEQLRHNIANQSWHITSNTCIGNCSIESPWNFKIFKQA